MVALDGSLRTECVLPSVVHLSRTHRASVLLVHVVSEPEGTSMLSSSDDLALARSLVSKLEAAGERYLSRLRNQLLSEVSRVETLVFKRSDQRRALLEVARDERVDLLVLAAHGATCDAEDPFGSVALHALGHAGLPLLVLQDLPSFEGGTTPFARKQRRCLPCPCLLQYALAGGELSAEAAPEPFPDPSSPR